MRRSALLGALALAVLAPAAQAQRLTGGAQIYNAQHRVLYADSVLEQTGMLIGGEGAVRFGKVWLRLAGVMGSLSGDDPTTNPDRDVRMTSIGLHVAPSPAVMLGVEMEVKRFESDLGVTAWRLMGVNIRFAQPLGLAGLSGLADVTYWASAGVVNAGGPSIAPALRATFGLEYAPPRSRVMVRMAYRFERFDFEAGSSGPARLEQLRGAFAGIGVRLGR